MRANEKSITYVCWKCGTEQTIIINKNMVEEPHAIPNAPCMICGAPNRMADIIWNGLKLNE